MKRKKLDYIAWHGDAERRIKLGQKQRQCICHGLWHWYDHRKGHRFKKQSEGGRG